MPSGSDSRNPQSKTGAKSAKAIRAASKKKRVPGAKGLAKANQIPWMTIGAVVVVLALIGVLAFNLVPKFQEKREAEKFTPTESNQDPSKDISGVVFTDYPAGLHVQPNQRVAYDHFPPSGGPHDQTWATCTGTVYSKPIRTENAVHSLEHGAVWIAYNPDKLDAAGVDELKSKVDGQPYMMLSPYPGLDTPIALQSWGHQLKLDSADDKRIAQFIAALRLNKYTYKEVGASCATVPGAFDPDNPPAFDPNPPGPDAIPMDGKGLVPDQTELGGGLGLPPGAGMPGLPGSGDVPGLPPGAGVPPAAPAPAPAP